MKNILAVLTLCFLCACSNESDDVSKSTQKDSEKPEIEISGLTTLIEKTTTIEVSVSDESEIVYTKIVINGIEAFETQAKVFSLDIDPFDYPNGKSDLKIYSKDGSGNENELSYDFELKKLLIRAHWNSSDPELNFVAVNSAVNGKLLGVTPLEPVLSGFELFAEDGVERQPLIVSRFRLEEKQNGTIAIQSINSIAGIDPGTEEISVDERIQALGISSEVFALPGLSFSVDLMNAPDNASSYNAIGAGYYIDRTEAPRFKINYIEEVSNSEDLLFYYYNENLEGLPEGYRYHVFDEFVDGGMDFTSLKSLSENDLIAFEAPPEVNGLTCEVFGYANEDKYRKGRSRHMFRKGVGLIFEQEFDPITFKIPNLDKYPVQERIIDFRLKDSRWGYFELRNESDFIIPDWSVVKSDDVFLVMGQYDFFKMIMDVPHPNNEGDFLRWVFLGLGEESVKNPFIDFELPPVVVNFLYNNGFETDFNGRGIQFFMTDFETLQPGPIDLLYTVPIVNEYGNERTLVFPFE
jgi:hypothetical protein